MARKTTSKVSEAFKEPANAIGLAAVGAVAIALFSPIPLLIAGVAEAAYLLFVPDSKWFDARLAKKYDAEVAERRRNLANEVFPTLSADVKSRFVRLEQMRSGISDPSFEGKRWFQEVLRKLDYLLEKFLLFASNQVKFENYLRQVSAEVEASDTPTVRRRPPNTAEQVQMRPSDEAWVKQTVADIKEHYDHEIEGIRTSLPEEENLHNQAVLEKRKEILMRRKQYVESIGEILINIGHQLRLIEDTFGLINDEIRARSPEQVLDDIDDVVNQSDSLTETLQDVSPFDQMPLAAGADRLYHVEENHT